MPPGSLHVTGSDDLELHLLEWSSAGVPMLLLHGFGNEAHIWDDFSPRVAEHYRVLALDLRGHGESAWDPEGRYDYENHLADLDVLTTALGIERMVLVGHSLGGRISMLYAGRNPEKLAGLVIVDSAPELDARGIVRIRAEVGEQRDPSFASVAEYENLLAHNYPAATPEALRRMARHGLKQREDGRYVLRMDMAYRVAAGARAATVDDDVLARREESNQHAMWAALEALSSPTLVVRGAAPTSFPPTWRTRWSMRCSRTDGSRSSRRPGTR
jgi:pimeloyl-ACP methyl ester carboxylesterase